MFAIAIASLLAALQPHLPDALLVRDCRTACRTARDAIELAASAAPGRPPAAYYRVPVRAVGTDQRRFYINSERDYRDQRNISLSFDPDQARRLVRMMDGRSVEDALVGTDLVVWGRPERVRIAITNRGRPTRLYYYQTHIRITNIGDQLFRPG